MLTQPHLSLYNANNVFSDCIENANIFRKIKLFFSIIRIYLLISFPRRCSSYKFTKYGQLTVRSPGDHGTTREQQLHGFTCNRGWTVWRWRYDHNKQCVIMKNRIYYFWTLEGAVTERGAQLQYGGQSHWPIKSFQHGRSHDNMAFYCQWPINSFTEISVSLAFASNFFINTSSRRSSRCPRTISLDDRDYTSA